MTHPITARPAASLDILHLLNTIPLTRASLLFGNNSALRDLPGLTEPENPGSACQEGQAEKQANHPKERSPQNESPGLRGHRYLLHIRFTSR